MRCWRASDSPRPTALLPDFTVDDYSALEAAVLALVPTDPEQLADIEQVVEAASADPENRKLLAKITERLPTRAQLARLSPWAVMVSLDMLKMAPDLSLNDIGVLTMILMVVLYLPTPRSGS